MCLFTYHYDRAVKIGFFPQVCIGAEKILVFLVSKSDARTVNIVTSPILAWISWSNWMFQELQDPRGLCHYNITHNLECFIGKLHHIDPEPISQNYLRQSLFNSKYLNFQNLPLNLLKVSKNKNSYNSVFNMGFWKPRPTLLRHFFRRKNVS